MKKLELPSSHAGPRFLVAVRDILLVLTGRKDNRIAVPARQALTFSASPTQAECEALRDYTHAVRDALAAVLERLDT